MKKSKQLSNINTYLAVALVIVLAFSLYLTFSVPVPTQTPVVFTPARQLSVTLLGADCSDCINMSVLVDALKQRSDLNITEVRGLTLADSIDLAQKHNVSRLPAMVITGDLSN